MPETTAVIAISKSGGTIETVVQFLHSARMAGEKLGTSEARKHQWVVTDPRTGWLRELADAKDCRRCRCRRRSADAIRCSRRSDWCRLPPPGWTLRALLAGAADNAAHCASRTTRKRIRRSKWRRSTLPGSTASRQAHCSIMMPYADPPAAVCRLGTASSGPNRSAMGPRAPGPHAGRHPAGARHGQRWTSTRSYRCTWNRAPTRFLLSSPRPLRGRSARSRWAFDAPHFRFSKTGAAGEVIDAEFRATRQVITVPVIPT